MKLLATLLPRRALLRHLGLAALLLPSLPLARALASIKRAPRPDLPDFWLGHC